MPPQRSPVASFSAWLRALLGVSALVLTLPGAEPQEPTFNAGLLLIAGTWAAGENIPLGGFDPLREDGAKARVGDTVVAVVSMQERQKPLRQWILTIESVELTPEERALKSPPGETMHTISGLKVRFESERQALALRLAGPFYGDERAAKLMVDKRSRALVKADFLGLGLDRTAQFLIRLRSSKLNYGISNNPFPPERVAKGKAEVEAAGLTPKDEEATAGFPLAMMAFFDVAQRTPGLDDLLFEMISKSSVVWSMVKSGGKLSPSFEASAKGAAEIALQRWEPPVPGYLLPVQVTLNKKPLLNCVFTVTAPRPPLVTSAGVLKLVVGSTAYPDKVLAIEVLSAKHGAAADKN